jgi:phage head maturation protease
MKHVGVTCGIDRTAQHSTAQSQLGLSQGIAMVVDKASHTQGMFRDGGSQAVQPSFERDIRMLFSHDPTMSQPRICP